MAGKFEDITIRNLKPQDRAYTKQEKGGFGIKVYPTGTKVFFFVYRVDGQRRFLNLGEYYDRDRCKELKEVKGDKLTLVEARELYDEKRNDVKKVKAGTATGPDPVELKRQAREQRQLKRLERERIPTVASFIDEYLTRHAAEHKRPSSQEEDKRILIKEIVPLWGDVKITDIKRRDLTPILDGIKDRGAPVMANRVLACVRKMFSVAADRHVIEVNPFLRMSKPSAETPKERYLSEEEIRIFWNSLDNAKMEDETRRALKIILLTGQRPGEIVGMHSKEIIDDRWLFIPGSKRYTIQAKNKQNHLAYLPDLALDLIREQIAANKKEKEIPNEQEYVGYIFESPVSGLIQADGTPRPPQPITERALSRALLRSRAVPMTDNDGKQLFTADGKPAVKNLLGVDDFTPHDLRRTCATMLSDKLKLSDEIIDVILNHKKQGVRGTYNRNTYEKEKQTAMEAWERKLQTIITGKGKDNVVSISKGKSARKAA